MKSTTLVSILDEAVYVLVGANILVKGMYPFLFIPAMCK